MEGRETSVVDLFPNVLGGDSSPEGSRASQRAISSLAKEAEVPASGPRCRAAVAEISEDEGDSLDAARLAESASFPLLYSKCFMICLVLDYFSSFRW